MQNEKDTKKRKHIRRIRNLVFVCAVCTLVFVASTYTWFVGMQEVNVDSFEINVQAAESLELSLDGATWSDTISFTQATLATQAYKIADGEGNLTINSFNWPSNGLVPLSSVGEMDTSVSRMKLFEKASLTTTPGGYRLLASRVNNYNNPELTGVEIQDGYLAFDLFIKNFSGTNYNVPLDANALDEEAIYLTTPSSVTVGSGGTADTGIENSVRVAFAQIGRVNAYSTSQSAITGITCANTGAGDAAKDTVDEVTGICRTAQIWEPNDIDHVDAAISWYQTSCLTRKATGTDVTSADSYIVGGTCGAVTDGEPYDTYAIKAEVLVSDNVDVYDGADYNSYPVGTDSKLYAYPYFTDTMKNLKGTKRPTFMTLAPNSITKVRVYVWIEGQDIDNYDFASIGKQIAVNFGFSKERYTTTDINYTGPVTEDLPNEVQGYPATTP